MMTFRRSFQLLPLVLALALAGCQTAGPGGQDDARTSKQGGPSQAEHQRSGKGTSASPAHAASAELPALSRDTDLCKDQRLARLYAHAFLMRQPLPTPSASPDMQQARCAQKTFVQSLIPSAGPIVGYKRELLPAPGAANASTLASSNLRSPHANGTTSTPTGPDSSAPLAGNDAGSDVPAAWAIATGEAKQAYAAPATALSATPSAPEQPVRGTLLEKMMLPNQTVIDASFGSQPRIEADLVAVVRSAAIHDARTPREVLASLSALHPFIELSDLAYQDPSRIDAAGATVVNVNGRFGVLGPAIDIQITQEMVDQLGSMKVRLEDSTGKVLSSAEGRSLAGHPLNAVVWLANDLQQAGIRLRPGDMLSLGRFGDRNVPESRRSYRLVFEGLPNAAETIVHLR